MKMSYSFLISTYYVSVYLVLSFPNVPEYERRETYQNSKYPPASHSNLHMPSAAQFTAHVYNHRHIEVSYMYVYDIMKEIKTNREINLCFYSIYTDSTKEIYLYTEIYLLPF